MEPVYKVTFQQTVIDVTKLRGQRPESGTCGGYATFEGVVRNHNQSRTVTKLHYECYEELATKELEDIVKEVASRHGVVFCEVVHRLGELMVGDVAVYVQVYSHHRREAFATCEEVMDRLKQTVPIWKKEFYSDGHTAWPRCQHGAHN